MLRSSDPKKASNWYRTTKVKIKILQRARNSRFNPRCCIRFFDFTLPLCNGKVFWGCASSESVNLLSVWWLCAIGQPVISEEGGGRHWADDSRLTADLQWKLKLKPVQLWMEIPWWITSQDSIPVMTPWQWQRNTRHILEPVMVLGEFRYGVSIWLYILYWSALDLKWNDHYVFKVLTSSFNWKVLTSILGEQCSLVIHSPPVW